MYECAYRQVQETYVDPLLLHTRVKKKRRQQHHLSHYHRSSSNTIERSTLLKASSSTTTALTTTGVHSLLSHLRLQKTTIELGDNMETRGSSRKRHRTAHVELHDILRIGKDIMQRDTTQLGATLTEERRFRDLFGCASLTALTLWAMLVSTSSLPDGGTVRHMMWALMLLKTYGLETEMTTLAGGVDRNTFGKWVWLFIPAIASLESLLIIWESRHRGDVGNDCLVSVDGTDFQIAEHGPEFYSHKFKKSGLRYEVAVNIKTGDIVWLNGPYECGMWPDIKIFRNSLLSHLGVGERVEADDGYIGESPEYVKCKSSVTNTAETEPIQRIVRMRHETVNKRFKQSWGILSCCVCSHAAFYQWG